MSANENFLKVSVWRGDNVSGKFENFTVPALGNQTVLDVVTWIQQNEDPTVSYRFSCRVGMCGSCAMMVNGVPRWTCRTQVMKATKGDSLEIAPLRNLPVVKDLVTDMDPFFEKWLEAEGLHHPSKMRDDPIEAIDPKSAAREEANIGIECINCAICYASCDTVAGNPDYLGPAALQRAWTLYNDEKDQNRRTILDAVSGKGGCHNCHSQGSCALYCPKDLNPMKAIAGLKKATASSFFTRRK